LSDIIKITSPLVSVNWLQQHLDATNLIVLDATLPKVTAQKSKKVFEQDQIYRARFFDIKKIFSDVEGQFPNTMLSPLDFQKQARDLGIFKDSCIIVYDRYGIYSSARVWWSFKAMGFKNIAVLDGGLPAWKNAGGKTEHIIKRDFEKGNFESNYKEHLLVDSDYVLASIHNKSKQVLDARSTGRFYGKDPEPREGVRSGHIPNAKSLPYSNVLFENYLKSKKELQHIFETINPEKKEMIFSCGTGITACVLALGAEVSGYPKISVYDGSWTEWGSLADLPIEKLGQC
jgi:thiosulfate/3-mercaptopyruvate sulfurtransferase